MDVTTVHYDDLLAPVRTAIECKAGPILKTEAITAGLNSALSARIHTADADIFLKGLSAEHRRQWTQQREADINPYVTPLAPACSSTPSLTAGASSASKPSTATTPTTGLAPSTCPRSPPPCNGSARSPARTSNSGVRKNNPWPTMSMVRPTLS
ncbi:hypothetical protein [Streptomyces sp. NBC_00658]|uniref:hypothetical protein n=1 Tax=Streptomyces sp. NBC_00658 TaxID=2975800 RepID=UPI003252E499